VRSGSVSDDGDARARKLHDRVNESAHIGAASGVRRRIKQTALHAMLRGGRLLSRVVAARGRSAALPPLPPAAAAYKLPMSSWQLGRPPSKRLPPPEPVRSDAAFRGLIAANVGIWVLWQVAPRDFMLQNFALQEDSLSRPHTLLTAPFSHPQLVSLFSTCLSLCFFGFSSSLLFGHRVAHVYVGGGAVSSLVHVCWARSSRATLAPALEHAQCVPGNEAAQQAAPAPRLSVPSRIALGGSGANAALLAFQTLAIPYGIQLFGTVMPTAFLSALWVAPAVHGAFEGRRGRGNTAHVANLCGMAVGGAAYLAWKMRFGRW
jgi:hypothetical protein